jgi:exonuclease III
MGYNIFTRYLSDNRPYIVEGEEWTNNNQKFCFRDGENNIKSKNNSILRVCSFNVHNFVSRCNQDDDPLFGNNINIFDTPRNIDKFIKMFKEVNADVLCLQEVIPLLDKPIIDDILDIRELQKINFEFLNKKMEEIGYKYRVIYDTNAGNFTKNESTDYIYNSNAIYSKYPIFNSKGYQLFVNANICFVDIKVKGKLITIGNTQLNSNIQNGKIDESNKISKDENILLIQNKVIKHIVEQFVGQRGKQTYSLILCGDFNLNIYQNYDKVYNKQLEPNEEKYYEGINNGW